MPDTPVTLADLTRLAHAYETAADDLTPDQHVAREVDAAGVRLAQAVLAFTTQQATDLARLDRRLLADAEAKVLRDRAYIEGLRIKINDAAGIT